MNKDEMIKDIPANIIAYDGNPKGQHLYIEQRKEIAEALYTANYRKLADDEIIVVPSEYDTITEFYERWKEADRKLYNARQDIANEIVKDLLPLCDYYPVYVLVNRLCKKFGLSMEGLDE